MDKGNRGGGGGGKKGITKVLIIKLVTKVEKGGGGGDAYQQNVDNLPVFILIPSLSYNEASDWKNNIRDVVFGQNNTKMSLVKYRSPSNKWKEFAGENCQK